MICPTGRGGGDPIELRGAGESRLRLAGLGSEFAAIELWTDGIGYDRSARVVRGEEPWLGSPVAGPLQAHAGRDVVVAPAREATLDARQSRQPGSHFASHEWRLMLAPPGSATSLTDSRSAVQRFSPFTEGVYLFELVSRAAEQLSVDTVRVTVSAAQPGPVPGRDLANAGPDLHARAGQPIRLDGRGTLRTDFSPGFYEWRQRPLDPNAVSFSDAAAARPLLTAQRPGFTEVQLLPRPGDIDYADTIRIYVDAAVAFTSYADLYTPSGPDNVKDVAWGDVTGNGLPDLVTVGLDVLSDAPVLRVYAGHGDRRFDAPLTFEAPANAALALADLDGDGRLDVVMRDPLGFEVRYQQVDGSLGPSVRMPHALTCPEDAGVWQSQEGVIDVFAVGDFDGDGRPDLVHVVQCQEGGVEIRRQHADGMFAAPEVYPLPAPGRISVGDLNGNGRTDLSVTVAEATSRQLLAGLAEPDGTLTWVQPAPTNALAIGTPVIAALNGEPVLLLGRSPQFGFSPSIIDLFRLSGEGDFVWEQFSAFGPTLPSALFPLRIDVVDVDGDGLDDLVWQGGTLAVMQRGRPTGDFDEPVAIPLLTRNAINAGSSRFIWTDVDGDGRVDVIYADNVSRTIESTSRRGVGGIRLQTVLAESIAAEPSTATQAQVLPAAAQRSRWYRSLRTLRMASLP